jgi:hypothetical protein
VPVDVPERPAASVDEMPALTLDESGDEVVIEGEGLRLVLDKATGALASWESQGATLLAQGPRLNAWRAPTDNDAARGRPESAEQLWREVGLDRLAHAVESVTVEQPTPQAARITVESRVAAPEHDEGFDCRYVYTILGDGTVTIDVDVTPQGELPFLPRLGLQMALPGGFETVSWYGRGPHESYIDRQASAIVGRYSGTVDEQYVPYVVPQENGNKTDVRWVALTDERGAGLLAVGEPPLEVSAHHFTTEDLTVADHLHELERRDEITLNLDYRQCGLGGASCGPGVLPQYLLQPEPVQFRVMLRPLAPGQSPDEAATPRVAL